MTMPLQSAGPALGKRNGVWAFGAVLALLLFAGWIAQSFLQKGWTTYSDHDSISALTVDPQGHVWMVVNDINENGVSIASLISFPDDGEPVRIPLPDQLAGHPVPDGTSDTVLSLSVDPLGRVWVRTVNGRLAVRDMSGEWRFFGPETLEGPFVAEIAIDAQGQAWTSSGNLARILLDPAASTYELVDFGVEKVDTITVDSKGQLWVLRTSGDVMTLLPDGNWASSARAPKADPVTEWAFTPFGPGRLTVDRQGQIWIGVGNGIVHVLGLDGVWQTHRPEEPHPTIYTERVVIDDQGYLWGVTGYQGLYRFNPSTGWTPYNPRNSGLPAAYAVTTLATDGQGRVWIGTFNGGLVRFDPDQSLPVKYVPALSAMGTIVIPATLVSILAVMVWTTAFTKRGTGSDQANRKFWTIALGSFGAAICGLYALGKREMLADQFMEALFGEGWTFADVLVMVTPAVSILLVLLATVAGWAIGIGLIRLSGATFRK